MRRVYQMDHSIRIGITPLIDVTFLLLIFFMCAMKFKTLDMNELARHAMEDLDPDYFDKVSPDGGFLVAG